MKFGWLFPVLVVALETVLTSSLLANGGTFATASVEGTGQLVPQKKTRIQLESELLKVELSEELALVEVEYRLMNRGGADTVTFGFPIDSLGHQADAKKGVSDYSIEDGRRRLGVRKIIHEPAEMETLTEGIYGKRVRDWYMSDIPFARGERKTVRVTYRVPSLANISGTSKSFRWHRSEDVFRYSFQPAAAWGNGRVASLRIEVDASALQRAKVPITGVQPEGAFWEKGLLVWQMKDVDLANAPDLALRFDLAPRLEDKEIGTRRLDRKFIESVRASSTLPSTAKVSYGLENLFDGRPDTAWIEGRKGPGVGEWIEITFKRGIKVAGVGLLNGYHKSAAALADNGSVRRVRVHCTPGGDWSGEEITVEKASSLRVGKDPSLSALQWVFDSGEGAPELRKVRLTITAAEPGARYADTAISELFIYAWEKPKD